MRLCKQRQPRIKSESHGRGDTVQLLYYFARTLGALYLSGVSMQWLITGGDHIVGRALAREAVQQSQSSSDVRVLVSDPEGAQRKMGEHRPTLVKFQWNDDETALTQAMEGCDVVAHTDVGNPWSLSRKECEEHVLVRTEIVLSSAKKAGVKRVIFRSTDRVTSCGDERRNVDEALAHSPQWLSPWDEMMSVAEGLVLAQTNGVEGVALRPAFVWGEDDDESLPRVKALSQQGKLNLPGSGEVSFCTTHAENLAVAFLAAAKAENVAGNAYWIVDEDHITARKFLTRLLVAHGVKGPRSGMLPYRVAAILCSLHEAADSLTRAELAMYGVATSLDTRRAREELGYEPRLHVDDGMKRFTQEKP